MRVSLQELLIRAIVTRQVDNHIKPIVEPELRNGIHYILYAMSKPLYFLNISAVATVLNPTWSDPESKLVPMRAEIRKLAQ